MTEATNAGVQPGETSALVDHLFRHHGARLTAGIVSVFGLQNVQLAEDVVQESMIEALRTWPYRGVPDKPVAWLTQVAKNRALDIIRHNSQLTQKAESIKHLYYEEYAHFDEGELCFSHEIQDEQLKLIFSCCNSAIPESARLAILLKLVGGFSTHEIAATLFEKSATIGQRITRAKQGFLQQGFRFELPVGQELEVHLNQVLEVIYLIFNKGYMAWYGDKILLNDVCHEAIRLCYSLTQHAQLAQPKVHALMALMLFQAARFPARNSDDFPVLLSEQDRSLWNQEMIARGFAHLKHAAQGSELTDYHLEAEIASYHIMAGSFATTNWEKVLECYDALLARSFSPVSAINRGVALLVAKGPLEAKQACDALHGDERLKEYIPWLLLQAELHEQLHEPERAADCLKSALQLSHNEQLSQFLRYKIGQVG